MRFLMLNYDFSLYFGFSSTSAKSEVYHTSELNGSYTKYSGKKNLSHT